MSDHMKTKFAKTNHKLTTSKKPHPTNLPYTTSTLVTPPLTSKDFYHYITPYIKYYTLKEGNNTDLFVITPTNKIAIHGFTDPIIDIQIFRFKNSIDSMNYGLLVVTKNQMIIYGIEIVDNEFALVNINITVYVGDDIRKVVISDGNIIFCTKNDLYQFFYMSGFFNTSYIYRYKGIKDYFISFFTSENNSIKDICINKDYAAVLREKCIEVYRVTDSLKLYKRLETGSAIAIYFYSDNIFFTVDSFGNRVFYNENTKILDVASPQSFTFYDGNTCVSSDGDTLVIVKNKKNEKNSIVMVVTQNEYYKQSEPNKENYQTFTINDEIECIKVFDRHIIMKSQEYTHKLTITPPGQYFLKCKHLELTALHKLYGTNDFLLHYLSLIEEGFDVSKLDFLFLKADDYDFIYEYAYKRLLVLNNGNSMINGNQTNKKNLLNSRNLKINAKDQCEMYSEAFLSPCSDDYIIKLCRTINAFKAVYAKLRKYRKDNFKEVIDDLKALIDTLKFVKIINERRVDISCDFESLLFSKDYRKNILEELSASLPYDKLNQIVTETLKDYFPIEEIFFRKGMENVKKKRRDTLYESINDFKECNNVEEIIRIYDENRFYTGSVTMIKDRMFGRSEIDDIKRRRIEGTNSGSNIGKVTKALRNSVKCKGAFEKALDDYREDFVFCLLEAVLKNVLQGVEFKERCTCCDRDSWKLDFSSSLAIARIKSPYLEKFLESKFENSNDEEEYNLYWKYNILNNNKDKAREILMKIIKEKPITLEKRIKFLERSVVLFQSNEIRMMLQVAEIQRELSKSMPECLSLKVHYYDQNELFNDWLSNNNPFLALKLLQVCKCNDSETKKELLTDLFDGDYEEAIEKVSFYSELNKKGWIEIELIGDIIIGKLEMVQKTSLMHVLKSFNYDEIDIKRYMEKRLKDSVFGNPEQKRRILREYKEYYGYCEKTMEFENYCYKNYGVKV